MSTQSTASRPLYENNKILLHIKTRLKMTDNYTDFAERHKPSGTAQSLVAPLTAEEKAELKMRILLAINKNMA